MSILYVDPVHLEKRLPALIAIGIRVIKMHYDKPENSKIHAVYALIPTKRAEWFRSIAEKSAWEGSYVPLIIYKSGTLSILVPRSEVDKEYWEMLARKIIDTIEYPVTIMGD